MAKGKGKRSGAAPVSTANPAPALREMEIDEFLRRLKADDNQSDKRFAMFLGAGCSVSSGIPAAGKLVSERWIPRLCEIHAPGEKDPVSWAAKRYAGFCPEKAAEYYGRVMNDLFVTPDDRRREIETLCDGRSPAFGYAVLAQLIARDKGRFNVVLTTNFDDLVADALYLYTESRPLVIQHESLAAFIRPTRTRPLIVKLHGDHRLAPRNTALETARLEQEISRHAAMVLNDRGLIFIGYGGNDQSILELLVDLPREALPAGAYWLHPQAPEGKIREWLTQRGGVWVQSGWFDEVMLLARNTFDLPHPQPERFTKIFSDYQEAFQKLSSAIEAKAEGTASTLKAAVQETERSLPDFWSVLSEASRLKDTDPAAAENLYRTGVEQFPKAAPLLSSYAFFLEHLPERRTEAEVFYKRAIEADPRYARALCNYADYLQVDKERGDEAEGLYRRAIEADPKNPYPLTRYAQLLQATGRLAEAETFFHRAATAEPDPYTFVEYASFLEGSGRGEEAEFFFRRAIETDPTYTYAFSRYAQYLSRVEGREPEAEHMFDRALSLDPDRKWTLLAYAHFLEHRLSDPTRASQLRQRAEMLPG